MRSAVKFVDGLVAGRPGGARRDPARRPGRLHRPITSACARGCWRRSAGAHTFKGRFYMSLSEAIAAYEHSDSMLRNQLILRECAAVLRQPRRGDALRDRGRTGSRRVSSITSASRRRPRCTACARCCKSLAALEGPKSVILISEGLVLEGLGSEVDEIAAIAADVRASLDVMLLDVPGRRCQRRPAALHSARGSRKAGQRARNSRRAGARRPASRHHHERQRVHADHALDRGPLPDRRRSAARRSRRTASPHLGEDRTGGGRPSCSRRGFLAPTGAAASSADRSRERALRSPLTMNDVRMRLATWTYKEPGSREGAPARDRRDRTRLGSNARIHRRLRRRRSQQSGTATAVEPRTLREPAKTILASRCSPAACSSTRAPTCFASPSVTARGGSDRSSASSTRGR